jgi:hypothetical protein
MGLWDIETLETPSTAPHPAAEQARPQPEAVSDVKPEQTPVPTSAPAHKPKENPAKPVTVNTAKAAAVPTVPAPRKENNIVQEEETVVDAESKPADMKVVNGFDKNPYLTTMVKPLLPSRTSLAEAASGFKKEKEFVAALHLSNNLNIPFGQIKTRMTGEHRMSLTDALRDIRSDMTKKEAKAEVKKAEGQAKDDQNRAKDEPKLLSAS